MPKEQLRKRLAVAAKEEKADLVIINGKIVDVFNGQIIEDSVAIADGKIVGIGNYEGYETIDAKGSYICPGLIDAHVHIESSLVSPSEYAKVVVPHGVTTVITDPHELANVLGSAGIEYIIKASEDLPLDVYVMLPSSVPASPFDCAGATLEAEHLEPFFDHPRVKGLAEVMDFPAVRSGDDAMLNKILLTLDNSIHIDGHCAGLTPDEINIYRTTHIRTDHENTNAEDALEQISRGMYVIIREGSAAKDLIRLLPAISEKNSRRFLFCTDDKEIDEIIRDGTIDYNVRLAIEHGIDPITAIQIATLNAAECYHLTNVGAIAPGYDANLLLVDNLQQFNVEKVFKDGKLVAENGKSLTTNNSFAVSESLTNTINTQLITNDDLHIFMDDSVIANIIEIIPNSLHTKRIEERVDLISGKFHPSILKDHLKIVAVERHYRTGKVGLGIVKGFELKSGAIASTHAHDSHNIISIGTNDDDITIAVNHLNKIGGGFVVVNKGKIIAELRCPLAGLISLEDAETVNEQLGDLQRAIAQLGVSDQIAPFQLMSFLSLPVIPEIKLTCNGLFDVTNKRHIDIPVN